MGPNKSGKVKEWTDVTEGKVSKAKASPSLPDKVYLFKQIAVFGLAYLAYCSLYSTRKPFSVVKASLKENLGFTKMELGAIDTGFLTSYALGQLIIPSAAQKYAEPPFILFVAFSGSCACAFIFGSSSLCSVMFIIWTLNGAFHSAVYPLLVRSLAGWFSPTVRGQVLGSWTTSQQVGSFFATGFATYASSHFGWRSTFYFPAVLVGVMGCVIYFFLPRTPTVVVETTKSDKETKAVVAEANRRSKKFSSGLSHPSIDIRGMTLVRTSICGSKRTSTLFLNEYLDSVQMVEILNTEEDGAQLNRDCQSDGGRFPPSSRLSISRSSGPQLSLPQLSVPLGSRTCSRFMQTIKFPRVSDVDGTENKGPVKVDVEAGRHSLKRSSTTSTLSVQSNRPPVDLTIGRILNIADIKSVALAFFLIKCVRYSLLFWLPYFLQEGLGHDSATAGYTSMFFDLGGVPGAMFTGLLSDRVFSGRRLLTASIMTFFAALSILIFKLVCPMGLTPAIVSLFVVGFTVAGPDSILGAAAAQDLCDRSPYGIYALSGAAGVVNGMGSSGAVLQGVLTAHISEKFGWGALFVSLSFFLSIAMLLLWTTLRREYRYTMLTSRRKSKSDTIVLRRGGYGSTASSVH